MTPPSKGESAGSVEGFFRNYVNKTLTPLGIACARNYLESMLNIARAEQLEAVAQSFEVEGAKRISGKRIAWIVRGAKNLRYKLCDPLKEPL